jgi:hypothetical protein
MVSAYFCIYRVSRGHFRYILDKERTRKKAVKCDSAKEAFTWFKKAIDKSGLFDVACSEFHMLMVRNIDPKKRDDCNGWDGKIEYPRHELTKEANNG